MSWLRVMWGLVVDDGRMVSTLGAGLVLAYLCRLAHWPTLAAVIIWLSLLGALGYAVEVQLRKKLRSRMPRQATGQRESSDN